MTGKFLTAEQIRQLDEIGADDEANERTLRVALNFHSNAQNQIQRRLAAFWREIGQIHNLDLDDRSYSVRFVRGQHEIVEVDEEGKP